MAEKDRQISLAFGKDDSNRAFLGRLGQLHTAGIVDDIELEFTRFLSNLDPQASQEVLKAGCLASHLYRTGNVCVDLKEFAGKPLFAEQIAGAVSNLYIAAPSLGEWKSALEKSKLVGSPGTFCPLILDGASRLYLHKHWKYENRLASGLITLANRKTPADNDNDALVRIREALARLFPDAPEGEPDWQRVAAAAALRSGLTVISGGPGTGKTSTVIRMLALLLEQHTEKGRLPDIALAAPTGKAAARLKESIGDQKPGLNTSNEVINAIPTETYTLHRLLGARYDSSSFTHTRENPLPYDILVVDEASMIDQLMMYRLLEALSPNARLIVLGDKDQLASVEAGSLMGDICRFGENRFSQAFARYLSDVGVDIPEENIVPEVQPVTDRIVLLQRNYRFGRDSGIGQLSAAVNAGDVGRSMQLLTADKFDDIELRSFQEGDLFKKAVEEQAVSLFRRILEAPGPQEALKVFQRSRFLCAHRKGWMGSEKLNRMIEEMLMKRNLVRRDEKWYRGRPVMVLHNESALKLRNGDVGLVFPNQKGDPQVWFLTEEGSTRTVPVARLPLHETVFGMTVHKSQGSEFDKINLILPNNPSPVLTKELLYTAITRCRTKCSVWASEEIVRQMIRTRIVRTSGLRDYLWSGPD